MLGGGGRLAPGIARWGAKGVGVVLFLFLVGESKAVGGGLLLKSLNRFLIVQLIHLEHLFGTVVQLVVQDGQQQMLHIDGLGVLNASLQYRQFKYITCLIVKNKLRGEYGAVYLAAANTLLQLIFHTLNIDIQMIEQVNHRSIFLSQNAQHEMLRTNIAAG